MIRPAKLAEIPEILSLTKACAQRMSDQGIEQWNEHYPSEAVFHNDIRRGELHVLDSPEGILGCIAISILIDEEYKAVQWLTPNGNSVYIHRLAVRPDQQGKGLARRLMDRAEILARSDRRNSVRLDTFSKNERNQRFYEARGYQRLETVYFPKQSPYPFFCYELVL
jgi:ribosomal protein S18 acetylase RimI-like enzyme